MSKSTAKQEKRLTHQYTRYRTNVLTPIKKCNHIGPLTHLLTIGIAAKIDKTNMDYKHEGQNIYEVMDNFFAE